MASNFTKKTAAIALAAGLAFSGSAGIVAAPVADAQQISDINAEKGKITVHKRTNHQGLGEPNKTGEALKSEPGEGLDGAKFSLQKIDVDMTTDQGFRKAAGLKVKDRKVVDSEDNEVGLGAVKEGTTAKGGVLEFGDLEAGAYLLTETEAPSVKDKEYIAAAPMIVYVPVVKGDAWNRDVHVYPKNTELTTTKTVTDKDKQPVRNGKNDALEYTIKTNAPVMPQGRNLTNFSVNDYYNSKELLENTEGVGRPDVVSVKLGETQLTAEEHYSIVKTAYTGGDKGDADTKLEIKFTEEGLKKLTASKGGAIEVQLKGKVAKTTAKGGNGLEDGEILNSADSSGTTKRTDDTTQKDEPFNTPEDKVVSYFGAVQVIKTGENDAKLSGAEFELHKISEGKCADVKAGAATKIDTGATKLVTDKNGKFVINNLHVTDLQNSTETIDDTYCLLETKAPSGYQKLDKAIDFKLTKEDVKKATSEKDGENTYVFNISKNVENKKVPELTLPATGGMGVIALILAGFALLGGGAFAARRKTA